MLDDALKMTGRLTLELYDEHGQLRDVREVENLVTAAGKGVVANRMTAAPTAAAMSHMAVGTGSTAAAASDTSLAAELAGARPALASTNIAGPVITYAAAFGPGVGTGALQEAGIFNAGAAGTMLARTTFAIINKAAGDTLNVTWTVTVG